jgi:endonuclease YncB( thermonuclease family)
MDRHRGQRLRLQRFPDDTPFTSTASMLFRHLDFVTESLKAFPAQREQRSCSKQQSTTTASLDRWRFSSLRQRIETGSLQLHSYFKDLTSGYRLALARQPGSKSSPKSNRAGEWVSMALALGAAALLIRWAYLGVHRFATVDHLPPRYFALPHPQTGRPGVGRRLSGLVVHVGDGDNFRVLHTPLLLRWWIRWRWWVTGGQLPGRGTLASQTIHVRLAGIDAPECAHFGLLGQRFGPEAKAWLQRTLLNQPVRLVLYQRDRFGRVVAHAWRPLRIPFLGGLAPGRNVSLEMVRAGYAEVYRGAGACYGHLREALEKAEQQAIRRRVGMWAGASALRLRQTICSPLPSTTDSHSQMWQRFLAVVRRPSDYKRLARTHRADWGVSVASPPGNTASQPGPLRTPSNHPTSSMRPTGGSPVPTSQSTIWRPHLLLRALSSSVRSRIKKHNISR